MSLNAPERAATSAELRDNLSRAGLSETELAERLGVPQPLAARVLDVDPGADPVLVWAARDALEEAVREHGAEPRAYSVLTERARSSASRWFGIPER